MSDVSLVVIAVFASVSTEACVRAGMVVFLVMVFGVMVCDVRRLNGDLHGHWLLVVDWQRDVLLVDDRSVNRDMNVVGNGFLDDIRNLLIKKNCEKRFVNPRWRDFYLLHDFVGLRDWHFHRHMDVLLNLNWVWSEKEILLA